MLTLMLTVVVAGLVLSAVAYLGEESGAGKTLDDTVKDAFAEGEKTAEKTADKPDEKAEKTDESAPTEDAAPPEKAPEEKAEDEPEKPAAFKKAMSDLAKFIPEAQRRSFQNRIEQAERWAKRAGEAYEAKELRGRFAEVQKVAESQASRFEGGEDILSQKGPIAFLQMVAEHDRKKAQVTGQAPDTTAADPVAELAKKVAALERKKDEDEQRTLAMEAKNAFDEELNPVLDSILEEDGIPADYKGRTKLVSTMKDLTEAFYFKMRETSPNPDTVTATAAAKAAWEAFKIRDEAKTARQKTTQKKPPTMKVEEGAGHASKTKKFSDAVDDLMEDTAKAFGEAPES
jgi:hypothetical protein